MRTDKQPGPTAAEAFEWGGGDGYAEDSAKGARHPRSRTPLLCAGSARRQHGSSASTPRAAEPGNCLGPPGTAPRCAGPVLPSDPCRLRVKFRGVPSGGLQRGRQTAKVPREATPGRGTLGGPTPWRPSPRPGSGFGRYQPSRAVSVGRPAGRWGMISRPCRRPATGAVRVSMGSRCCATGGWSAQRTGFCRKPLTRSDACRGSRPCGLRSRPSRRRGLESAA